MQSIHIVETSKSYQSHFLLLAEKDYNVKVVPLAMAEKSFVEAINLEELSTFIVDIDAVGVINCFLDIVHRNYPVSENVRLIVISDLQTWSNTLPIAYASNITGGFRRRRPAAGALEKYSLENTLYDVARSGDLSLRIVYMGMIYGGRGWDFQNVFMDIWSNKFALPSPPSSANSSNSAVLGHIHQSRLLTLMSDVISNPQDFPSIIPAFDNNPRPLVDIFAACNLKVNPNASPIVSENSNSSVAFLLQKEKYSANVSAFIPAMQSTKQYFDKHSDMESQWDTIWAEFVSANGLRPVRSLVAGPPKTGKTEHAKGISDKLQIKYVDLFSAVHYVLMKVKQNSTTEESSPEIQPEEEPWIKLRLSLIAAIDAKLAEGTKPSKDKNAVPKTIVNSDGKVDDAQINPSIIASAIPGDLQRQCLEIFLLEDVMCCRRGFVLDIWENEALRPVHEYLITKTAEATSVVDIIFEIKCDDKKMVQQLQESYGAGFAKNKEGQAAVKALEATLSAYSAGLTTYVVQQTQPPSFLKTANAASAVGFAEDNNEIAMEQEEFKVVEETKQVHSAVKAILDSCTTPAILLIQRDLTEGEEGTVGIAGNALRVADVSEEILRAKVDALGWCRLIESSQSNGLEVDATDVNSLEATIDIQKENNGDINRTKEYVEKTKPVDVSKMKGLQIMNNFLSNTVLPVLAGGMIQAIRNDVHDPIAFLADFLLAESAERQAKCEEEARQNFEDMLANC